mgnify:CR=1 FL=1
MKTKRRARRPPRGIRGGAPPPDVGLESELEVRTEDGARLSAVVLEPRGPMCGTAILAHAMFARRSTFVRGEGGLAEALRALGWRVVAFDFRGHGGSATPDGGDWGYDELVRFDLPAVAACVRARAEDLPVIVVGHSLGGHVALAGLATGALDVDGVLALATNVWMRRLERSGGRWLVKSALARVTEGVATRLGRLPARRIRLGSDDEAGRYLSDLFRASRTNAWTSADGRVDYLASLACVTAPVAAVVSAGDRLNCTPDAGERFARLCGGPVQVFRVSRADDGSPAPDHMQVVTTDKARSAIVSAQAWLREQLAPKKPRRARGQARP